MIENLFYLCCQEELEFSAGFLLQKYPSLQESCVPHLDASFQEKLTMASFALNQLSVVRELFEKEDEEKFEGAINAFLNVSFMKTQECYFSRNPEYLDKLQQLQKQIYE